MGTAHADAQILKKLKKKIQETTEKLINTDKDRDNDEKRIGETDKNLGKRTLKLRNPLYPSDLRIKITENGVAGNTVFIDNDHNLLRIEIPQDPNPLYIDGAGYRYVYREGGYEQIDGAKDLATMGVKEPWIIPEYIKLPPIDQTSNTYKSIDTPNLNDNRLLDWAYNYKPEHFRTKDFSENVLPEYNNAIEFSFNDPVFTGSKILFDDFGRLALIDLKSKGKSIQYKFSFVKVRSFLPEVKQIVNPFQPVIDKITEMYGPLKLYQSSSSTSGISENSPNNTPASELPNKSPVDLKGPKKRNKKDKGKPDPIPVPHRFDPGEVNLKKEIGIPLSFKIDLTSGNYYQQYVLDTRNLYQKIIYGCCSTEGWYVSNFVPGAPPDQQNLHPTYYDRSTIYTHEPKDDYYICIPLTKLASRVLKKIVSVPDLGNLISGLLYHIEEEDKPFYGEEEEEGLVQREFGDDISLAINTYLNKIYNEDEDAVLGGSLSQFSLGQFFFSTFRENIFENDSFKRSDVYDSQGNLNGIVYSDSEIIVGYDKYGRIMMVLNVNNGE